MSTSLTLDLSPIITSGFSYANMLLVGLGALLALVFGFGLFRYLFNMFRSILGNLGG